MASYTVSYIKFVRPQPDLCRDLQTSTILGSFNKGWTAQVDEEAQVMVVKVRKMNDKGKLVVESTRYPLSSVDNYRVTTTKPGDEPADPK